VIDRELWDRGIAAVAGEYALLPPEALCFVRERGEAIRARKGALHGIFHGVGGGDICASCRGECCARGKNHFTVIDLLVHLAAGEPVVTPDFEGGHCPYMGDGGCLMAPEFRPFNCVTFHCERIEGLLEPPEVERFYLIEGELRQLCEEVEEYFGNRFRHGLLVTYGRALAENGPVLSRRRAA